ncbi:MAG: division/cell wall cluster transcriptional repressor MraZ [Clostridia bacterium]|nr:division/cell wall cluster transcriptional repressor MraZ [Clostridia bacterium]
MLIGSYEHTFDAKGRVFVPAKWRDSLGDTLVVTLGLLDSRENRCLYGMSAPEWDAFSEKLSRLPITDLGGQAVRRMLYASAAACEVDKQGRILIPTQLREAAGLVKDVTLIGVGDRVEIWDPNAFSSYTAMTDESYEASLKHLAEIGI